MKVKTHQFKREIAAKKAAEKGKAKADIKNKED